MNTFDQRFTPIMFVDVVVTGAGNIVSDGRYKWSGYMNQAPSWSLPPIELQQPDGTLETFQRYIFASAPDGVWNIAGPLQDGITGIWTQEASLYAQGPMPRPYDLNPWYETAGPLPAPIVTAADPYIQPTGQFTLTDTFRELYNDLIGNPENMGYANAILISPMPGEMSGGNPTGIILEWNFAGGWNIGGFYSGNKKGVDYCGPLLIAGRTALENVKLACNGGGTLPCSYQLLTGNT